MEEYYEQEDIDIDLEEFNNLLLNEEKIENRRELFGSERRGKPFLGRFAQTHLIQIRAKQLERNEKTTIPPNIPIRSNNPRDIARQELELRVIPLKVVNVYPDGTFEKWSISEFKYFAKT